MGIATIGGVLLDPGGKTLVFGCNVPQALLEEWLSEFQHPIGLIELYAIVVAFNLWGDLFAKKKVILFGDNWSANDVFVKGTSSVRAWRNASIIPLVC